MQSPDNSFEKVKIIIGVKSFVFKALSFCRYLVKALFLSAFINNLCIMKCFVQEMFHMISLYRNAFVYLL